MYRKILVATDLTPTSFPAVTSAIELGRKLRAMVTTLFVVDAGYEARRWFMPFSAGQVDFIQSIAQSEKAAAERVLADQVREASPNGLVDSVELVRVGIPSDMICEVAKELGADLIVMGTHGRTGLSHAFLGSIAERVLRTAPCAVLTVREEAASRPR